MLNDRERVQISKFLSLVLRHQPQTAGIAMDAAGWVGVDELLAGCRRARRPITIEQLREVVATNDKKRFEFSPDGLGIRASQGHSIDVDLGYSPATPPEILYHGTAARNLESIRRKGLLKGERHHVHLSVDPDTATRVGLRYGKPVVLRVHSGRMHGDGHVFFLSANGVWLTERVPPPYLEFPEVR